jgi:hypothetical protein
MSDATVASQVVYPRNLLTEAAASMHRQAKILLQAARRGCARWHGDRRRQTSCAACSCTAARQSTPPAMRRTTYVSACVRIMNLWIVCRLPAEDPDDRPALALATGGACVNCEHSCRPEVFLQACSPARQNRHAIRKIRAHEARNAAAAAGRGALCRHTDTANVHSYTPQAPRPQHTTCTLWHTCVCEPRRLLRAVRSRERDGHSRGS